MSKEVYFNEVHIHRKAKYNQDTLKFLSVFHHRVWQLSFTTILTEFILKTSYFQPRSRSKGSIFQRKNGPSRWCKSWEKMKELWTKHHRVTLVKADILLSYSIFLFHFFSNIYILQMNYTLPTNALSLKGNSFHHIVEEFCGKEVVELLKFQLIDPSIDLIEIDDVSSILQFESDRTISLKEILGVSVQGKTNDYSFFVMPGIRLKFWKIYSFTSFSFVAYRFIIVIIIRQVFDNFVWSNWTISSINRSCLLSWVQLIVWIFIGLHFECAK